jgi:uncharacterized protein YbjT (DUF2867 family)
VSSMGVGESIRHYGFFVGKILLPLMLGAPLREKGPQEAAIMASSLDWTIVRPCSLVDTPIKDTWKVIEDPRQRVGSASLSRTDLATFLLGELSADRHLRKAISIIG